MLVCLCPDVLFLLQMMNTSQTLKHFTKLIFIKDSKTAVLLVVSYRNDNMEEHTIWIIISCSL